MKKRGFTLVEILAIIAVLGVIVVLVVPQLGGSTSTKEEKELEKVKEIIETAAKSYHSFNQDEYKISVDELVDNNYLIPNLTDPTTGEKLNGCVIVTKNKEGVYDYTYTSCDDVEVPLTIELNGGTTTQSFEDSYFNGTKIKLIEPTKQESIFNRWEIIEGNSILKNNTLIIGNTATTLYAIWDAWPRLTVDLNEGTTTQEFKNSYQSRTSFTLTNPTRTGYTFNGWEITEGDSIISGNNFTMGSKNTTIKASWIINTYTITYNLGGGTAGSSAPTSGTYGSTVTVSNPTRTGYTFAGWTVSGTGASMSGTSLTIGTSNITLTANWTANTYTIAYNLDGGSSGTNAPTSGIYDSVLTIDNPTRTGYTFNGWTVTSGLNTSTAKYGTSSSSVATAISSSSTKVTAKYFKNITATNGGRVTLTANWTVNTYTISYTLNGGTAGSSAPTSGTYGSTVTVSNPTRTGYTFAGWTVSGTGSSMSGTSLTIGAGNITLTANWTANTYTISYTLNGGTAGSSAPTSGTYGSTVTVSNPTRSGYTFTGWTVSGTGAIMSGTSLTIGAGNITLTANWKVDSTTCSTLILNYKCANASSGSNPAFTYTGNCKVPTSCSNDNWYVTLTSSGTLTFANNEKIDLYVVGGGGKGSRGTAYSGMQSSGGAGGGGGGAAQVKGFTSTAGLGYTVSIGGGSTKSTFSYGSTFTFTGGAGGNGSVDSDTYPTYTNGGSGGTASATGTYTGTFTQVAGKAAADVNQGNNSAGTNGSYPFGDSSYGLILGSSGGGGGKGHPTGNWLGGTGASGGSGAGAGAHGDGIYYTEEHDDATTAGGAGTANRGGGGGGGGGSGAYDYCSGPSNGGAGGSGVVVFRNAR